MVLLYYFLLILIGFALAYRYGRYTKQFLWREYAAMLAFPLLGIAGLIFLLGMSPFYIFSVGLFAGPVLEWLIGFFYHKIMGARLWVYERYPLPGRYTSWLTIPIWGFGLVLLWLVTRNFS